jgi:hypothetical protein
MTCIIWTRLIQKNLRYAHVFDLSRNYLTSWNCDLPGDIAVLGRLTAFRYHHLQSAMTKVIMKTRTRFM